MVHLHPLPGAARFAGNVNEVLRAAVRDAETLVAGGVDAVMIENFGDVPFYPGRVPAHVVAHMTAIAGEIRRRVKVPIGINVLRNDGCSALAVADAVGANFIRVNVLCGGRVTDQRIIQGIAHDLLRERAMLKAEHIKIFADVDVKHSAPLAPRPLEEEIADTIERGLADAIIVSGSGTGKRTDVEKVKQAKAAAAKTPVYVGSGVTLETIADYLRYADGFIVGTATKKSGRVDQPADIKRVRQLVAAMR
jgi:membrane complex biogenesis BtpA family protein